MSMYEPLGRSGITSLIGIGRDVMTYWIRFGVLHTISEPQGRGKHLRFEWYEANIAALMNQLRILGVKLETMLSIGKIFREAISYFDKAEISRDEVFVIWSIFDIEHEIKYESGNDTKTQIIDLVPNLGEYRPITDRVIQKWKDMPRSDFFHYLDSYLAITAQPKAGELGVRSAVPDDMAHFWRSSDNQEYRFAWGSDVHKLAGQQGAVAMISIDVTAALYAVWNRSEGEQQ